jgi:DNA modification methylase
VRLYSDPGDVVLDPFLGSGTTAVAAVRSGRHFVGIEKERRYVELARRNVSKARRSPGRPV